MVIDLNVGDCRRLIGRQLRNVAVEDQLGVVLKVGEAHIGDLADDLIDLDRGAFGPRRYACRDDGGNLRFSQVFSYLPLASTKILC